jgi:transcriptional regulator CBF1
MADSMVTEQTDLSSLGGSPGQKRKRELSSPGAQRSKRSAPPANMAVSAADTAAFIESAIEANQAAAAGGVNVADFNALQAAAADHSDSADPSNATSTAQAALGMYPTLHVPPSTEEQFAAQAAGEEHGHDNSFNPDVPHPDGLMDASPPVNQQNPTNGVQHQEHRYSSSGPVGSKPTVGSEEWHKMRKDNHKEGETSITNFYYDISVHD